jgi:methionyl-tRNA formyltransferase
MVDILCSDPNHPIWPTLSKFCQDNGYRLISSTKDLWTGDYLFLVSCTEILDSKQRGAYRHVLVIHESDLPDGRGWSPLAWQVLADSREIVITLFEATDRVDDGPVWLKTRIRLNGHELADEISAISFGAKANLIDWAVRLGRPLVGPYRRRTPEDSRLDPHKTIAEQFDLLRICEPRFPAFFEYRGHRYIVEVRKA